VKSCSAGAVMAQPTASVEHIKTVAIG
jgi:hypothetical protein